MKMSINLEKLIERVKFKYPLFRPIIENLVFICDETIGTAATNGKWVKYSDRFLTSLTPLERQFVIAHEISHVALEHIPRMKNKDSYIWNLATDSVINAFLEKDGLKMPEGCIKYENALMYSCEELYEILLKENPPKEEKYEKAFENHSSWGEDEEDEDKDGKPIDSREIFRENKRLYRKQLEKKNNDLIDSFDFSLIGSSNSFSVKPIKKKTKLIDWRYILKESIVKKYDYSYKNAEIENGVLNSNLIEMPYSTTEILIDTSASISDKLLRAFLKECKNILTSSELKVACFSDIAYDFQRIRKESDIDRMQFQGRGGTNFDAAIAKFSKKCLNKIIFTDGEGYIKSCPSDIIWVVFETTQYIPKNCKVIFVDKKNIK